MQTGNSTGRTQRVMAAACTAVVICFIFSNSLQTGTDSGQRSSAVLQILKELGIPLSELAVRKLAHVAEYALLGACLAWVAQVYNKDTSRRWICFLAAGALVAAVDEVIQLFVPDRSGQPLDVAIDSVGVILGFFIMRGIVAFAARRQGRKGKTA